ncbi:MAG TPA: endonuclease III [Bacteroidia bacterium]|nr:endonuclease III [Bacteroidia bacterium]
MTKKERYEEVISWFVKNEPVAETELSYGNPFELLVAVILSAQCTDKRVNQVSPELFKRFPDPGSLAAASPEEVFPIIRSISYPNSKAKHLVGMARMLMKDFKGQVPEKHGDLLKLPGVGRKTANVIVSVVFDEPAMAVDTHVFRVAARLGLTTNAKNPLQAEQQLVKNIPSNYLGVAHHWLILHGRYTCTARKPACEKCPFTRFCKHFEKLQRLGNVNKVL